MYDTQKASNPLLPNGPSEWNKYCESWLDYTFYVMVEYETR